MCRALGRSSRTENALPGKSAAGKGNEILGAEYRRTPFPRPSPENPNAHSLETHRSPAERLLREQSPHRQSLLHVDAPTRRWGSKSRNETSPVHEQFELTDCWPSMSHSATSLWSTNAAPRSKTEPAGSPTCMVPRGGKKASMRESLREVCGLHRAWCCGAD